MLIKLQHNINIIMKHFKTCIFTLAALTCTTLVFAQSTPKGIKGKIIDMDSSLPLAGVSIVTLDQGLRTISDENGEFKLPISKTGSYKLISNYMGYQRDTTVVNYVNSDWQDISIALVNEASSLAEVVVTRKRIAHSELALLDERKSSSLVVEKIGTQELSRKGVGDVAAAITKLSGTSKQEGSSQIFVRGLGDRYISTTLNGLPIPSQDPNFKNIDLSIFGTEVVSAVGVEKNYQAGLSGDFAGAGIAIASKVHQGQPLLEVSIGSSLNSNAVGKFSNFLLPDGPNFFGMSNSSIPQNAQGSYHFKNSWNAQSVSASPLNFGLRAGNSYALGGSHRLSVFANAGFTNNYGFREGINANFGAQGDPLKSFDQIQYNYQSQWNAMFNANYQISDQHQFSYNLMYIHSGNQSHDSYKGYIRDAAEDNNGLVLRNTFAQTGLLTQQLLGRHTLTDRLHVDWGIGYNRVNGDMPDRTQAQMRQLANGQYEFIRVNAPDNHRYNYFLKENELAANIQAKYAFGDDHKGSLNIGYSGKWKDRSFDVMQFNFDIQEAYRHTPVDPQNIDQFLGADGFGSFYVLKGFAGNAFQYYNGNQKSQSLFTSVEYPLTEKLVATAGFRFEHIDQSVDYYSIEFPKGENTIKKNAFLPSLNLKYEVDARQNIRFSASKTYTLPQFKERARFPYEEVTQVFVGNPYLYASDNYNVDLKWEMFPQSGELLSVTAFGKLIKNPINEIMIASATNDISYANTGDNGYVYGVEVEMRKHILETANNGKLSVGFNGALMNTQQTLDATKVTTETNGMVNIDPTHPKSSFTGASDFVMNADVSYNKLYTAQRDFTATVMYNYYSDKLYAIGTGQLGNRVDKGLGTLDFVLKTKLNAKWKLDLSAKNILNPAFERWQENVQPVKVFSYKRGVNFNLGLTYQL